MALERYSLTARIGDINSPLSNSTFKEPRDGSWKSRFLFMWCGDQKRSHLEHITGHNDFTKNGVHYVSWLDVVLNISARPPIFDLKMLMIVVVAVVLTDLSLNDRTGVEFIDQGALMTT
jgi:hypothetical protein